MLAGIIVIFCMLGVGALLIVKAMKNFSHYYDFVPNYLEEDEEEKEK